MAMMAFLCDLRTIRLRYFAASVLLVFRAALAHSHKIKRMTALPWPVRPDLRLLALCLLPGLNAAQFARRSVRPKACHVVANLDENQRGRNLVDAGDGLQQLVRQRVGLHGVEQASVDLGKLLLQRLNVGLKMRQHEQVPGAEIAFQTGAEFLALLFELAARQAEYLFNGLAFPSSTVMDVSP